MCSQERKCLYSHSGSGRPRQLPPVFSSVDGKCSDSAVGESPDFQSIPPAYLGNAGDSSQQRGARHLLWLPPEFFFSATSFGFFFLG